ncbi:hypothetical protein BCR41DRAFT_371692 [Lobosporangium transversale]|uniref:Uncharacterized protein n=1 Tax=Lobosporangium transversale TaxID=64571 RepID=A0A1Y2GL66_9FUNG|nr:hypothetical protein BCR41DRAFT_371692 [Lobosporangium transversale]ORZ12996.1 hypothetical protein BCR41DRAFT_371692 [Lobosporangium transversale]|eukprot:XP_021880345.1 hypothetical protein BCR41DRAFT_371692 [Lobosporangium transversale]
MASKARSKTLKGITMRMLVTRSPSPAPTMMRTEDLMLLVALTIDSITAIIAAYYTGRGSVKALIVNIVLDTLILMGVPTSKNFGIDCGAIPLRTSISKNY